MTNDRSRPESSGRPRLHFHTDHAWFAGCETMLVNLLSSPEIKREFEVTLSYRDSVRYATGLRQRVAIDFPVYPLDFREPSQLFSRDGTSRAPLHRIGRAVSRQLSTVPLLAYEIELLRRLFTRIRPDLLHNNNGGYPGALSARAAAIAAHLAGVPHVVMVLNNLAEGYDRPARWLELGVDRAVVASTDLFLAGSRASVDRVREVLRLDESRALAVPNGADRRHPTESVRETRTRLGLTDYAGVVFGTVALMEPRKGHRVLLSALERLVKGDGVTPDALRLVLLGDGPLRGELERFASDRGLAAHCQFLGEEANGMNVISALDVLVLPSIANEDFPNVVLEAMGAGKPVIASRIAGTPEQVVEEQTGMLVPPGDVTSLAAAMARLQGDAALRASMGAEGRRRYQEHFTAPAAVERYVACYRSLLGAPRMPAARDAIPATSA
jgi:glycosyltransferase involved in cell wall biosynthesis